MTMTNEPGPDWREAAACITGLEAARLDGALLMARTIAHEINNALSPVVGYGELLVQRLRSRGDTLAADQALSMLLAAEETAEKVRRLQRVVRLQGAAGAPAADLTVLDLTQSTAPTR